MRLNTPPLDDSVASHCCCAIFSTRVKKRRRARRPSYSGGIISRINVADEILVELCQAELPYKTESYETLVRRYEATVYRTCIRYLGDAQEAEEAAQDVFLRVFHGLKNFAGKSKFRTWLYRVVANECATRYRRMKRDSERQAEYASSVVASKKHSYENPHLELELTGPVADALHALSVADRQVIVLRHVSELTIPEISSVIQAKLSATKMRLSRAEKRLRENYLRLTGKSGDFLTKPVTNRRSAQSKTVDARKNHPLGRRLPANPTAQQ